MKKTLLSIGLLSLAFITLSCDSSSKKKETEKVEVTETTKSINELENEIAELFKAANESSSDYEKTESIFKTIEEKLNVLLQDPASKDYSFDLLKKQDVSIIVSEDGKLRVFSWDDLLGGSMRSYTNLFQYFEGDSPVVEIIHSSPESGNFMTSSFDQLYSVENKDGIHYFVLGLLKTGGMSLYESLQFISFDGNKLNFDDKLILVDGELKNMIDSSNEQIEDDNDKRLIEYNKTAKTIKQLEIGENGSKKERVFTFDGSVFK